MNMRQAREEAKKRWGPMAFVQSSRYHFAKDGTSLKGVGKWVFLDSGYSIKEYYGWAKTWEKAFERANEYEAQQKKGIVDGYYD